MVKDCEIRAKIKIRSQLITKWPAPVKYRDKTDAGAAINIRNERNFRFMKFARGVWISGKRWWKFNRNTRILDIGRRRGTQAQRSTRLRLKLHRASLVQFLQGPQIVREHPDLVPVLAPLFPLFLSSPFPCSNLLRPGCLSITVIFVINLSRCKNVLLRNRADLVPAPISCVPRASIDLARRFEGERGRCCLFALEGCISGKWTVLRQTVKISSALLLFILFYFISFYWL